VSRDADTRTQPSSRRRRGGHGSPAL